MRKSPGSQWARSSRQKKQNEIRSIASVASRGSKSCLQGTQTGTLGDIAGSVPDRCSKVNIPIRQVTRCFLVSQHM